MARTGSKKQRSIDQEDFIARQYGGYRVDNSGGTDTKKGDVKTPGELFECKQTGEPGHPRRSIGFKLEDFEKVADEAIDEGGLMPAMALRMYDPSSPLADLQGNVDFIVRLQKHDRI